MCDQCVIITPNIPDAPGVPELVLYSDTFKGWDLQLSCHLEDRGNPGAEQFLWTK